MNVKLDQTLRRLVHADFGAIKRRENKALLDQIEKSIQDQFNNMQINSIK